MKKWIDLAMQSGFTAAAPLCMDALQPRQDIRDMCRADKCGAYGKNWSCPPHCGTLQECSQKLQSYRQGILLQTTGTLQKAVDTKGYRETEQKHLQQFYAFCRLLKEEYPQALCLSSGGCRICQSCAYPEPCRFPQLACPSMEGYGLFVTQVCRDCSIPYYYGEKTVTYTACVLF